MKGSTRSDRLKMRKNHLPLDHVHTCSVSLVLDNAALCDVSLSPPLPNHAVLLLFTTGWGGDVCLCVYLPFGSALRVTPELADSQGSEYGLSGHTG